MCWMWANASPQVEDVLPELARSLVQRPAEGRWGQGAEGESCRCSAEPLALRSSRVHSLGGRIAGLPPRPCSHGWVSAGMMVQCACCACWSCPGGQPGAAAGSPWAGSCPCWPRLRAWPPDQTRPCLQGRPLQGRPPSQPAAAAAPQLHGCRETLHRSQLPCSGTCSTASP